MTYELAVNLVKRIKRNADRLKLRIAFCDKRTSAGINDATAECLEEADWRLERALETFSTDADENKPAEYVRDYRKEILWLTSEARKRNQITDDEFSAIVRALGELPL